MVVNRTTVPVRGRFGPGLQHCGLTSILRFGLNAAISVRWQNCCRTQLLPSRIDTFLHSVSAITDLPHVNLRTPIPSADLRSCYLAKLCVQSRAVSCAFKRPSHGPEGSRRPGPWRTSCLRPLTLLVLGRSGLKPWIRADDGTRSQ